MKIDTELKFKIGDIVRLRSGGPSMTVTSMETAYGADRIHTAWFDDGSVLYRGEFPAATLVLE